MMVGYLYWMATSLGASSSDEMASIQRAVTAQALTAVARSGVESSGRYLVEPTVTPGGVVLAFGAAPEAAPEAAPAVVRRARYVRVGSGAGAAVRVSVVPPGAAPGAAGDVLAGDVVGDVVYASYWPDDGAMWCADYDVVAGRCVSPVTSGDAWRDVVGIAAACPAEWLGRDLELPGVGRYRCLDTGAGARCDAGYCRDRKSVV